MPDSGESPGGGQRWLGPYGPLRADGWAGGCGSGRSWADGLQPSEH
jgi:hypothetical protein